MRPRALTACHEAGHIVASYCTGGVDDIDLIQVPTNGIVHGAGGTVSSKRNLTEIARDRSTAEREIVVALAGCEAMRELGLDASGGDSDEVIAAKVAVWATTSADDAYELLERCRARTKRLVATDRFQTLLVDMAGYLADPSHPVVSGELAGKLLRGWDPQKAIYRQPDYTFQSLAARYGREPWTVPRPAR